MRLGIFLALVASSIALDCNVGNLIVENGIITSKSIEQRSCDGHCSRTSFATSTDRTIVLMGCEENEVANFIHTAEKKDSCSPDSLEAQCYCSSTMCNTFHAEENIVVQPARADIGTTKCYVGYFAMNNSAPAATPVVNSGDTVMCATNSACASIQANNVYGYDVEAYFCIPTGVCNTLLGTTADGCGAIQNEQGTVNGCCCTTADCTNLASKNPLIVVPPVIADKNITMCYQGAMVNYNVINGGSVSACAGICASVSVKTYYGGVPQLLDLYTCDPVELCSAVGLNNQCGNIAVAGTNSLVRGCCCNTDNCIDPTQKPPKYPTRSLKCYTGLYVPITGYSVGAEMMCDGQCGRIEVPINNVTVKYMMCSPYSTCAGLGIANGDQCYNPPLEEETKLCCCSSQDNCNIDPKDQHAISPNVTFLPTNNYPILCYGGISLNGVPMTQGSYSMCSGECAQVSFVSTVFGQQHNTTLYTCDPVSMCESVGISNGCSMVQPGVTACCCDNDVCFDPNRKIHPQRKCFTGLYVQDDNLLVGGEMQCNGWCASLGTMVSNKNTTTYWCAPVPTCRNFALGMGGDNNCNTITGSGNTLTGCCCSESDNCNLPPALLPNVTALPVRADPPIVCYEALWVNGQNTGRDIYRVCDGECVSIFMGDKLANGTVVTSSLYTCDSASTCASMGLRNNCSTIDGTVTACCCDTDACIDPTVNRVPGNQLKCYVGVQSTWNSLSVGAELACDGYCANLTSVVNGIPFSSYQCMPKTLCRGLSLDNSCNQIDLDRAVAGCCCDSGDFCNVAGTAINVTGPLSRPEAPIACYSGIQVNGVFAAGSKFQACAGDCMSISLNTTYAGAQYIATLYTCDPTAVCQGLNVTNRCHMVEPGIEGCCCSDSGCIDPTKTPPKRPHGRPLTCWVGMLSTYNNLNIGAESQCFGSCASISSTVAGQNVSIFACAPSATCSALGVYDDCATIALDRSLTGCCCNNFDNCNAAGFPIAANHTARPSRDFPIACYQGLHVNGRPIVPPQWTACQGDCAMISINTTFGGSAMSADYFSCDPVSVCYQLGVNNNCSMIEPGVSGCCCGSDACIDPTKYPMKKPGKPLKCYVGIKSTAGVNSGSEVYCNGMCGYIHGLVGGQNVTIYTCTPSNICYTLELNDNQRRLPGDRMLTAACCDNYDNCNVHDPSIDTSRPVSPRVEYPITCYSGIFVNGAPIVPGGFQSCNGECVMMSLNTTYNGVTGNAQLYTCDPTAVCQSLGINNNCSTIETGLDGCCCNTNGCIDPTKTPAKHPGNPLFCYVGVRSTFNNLNVGASVQCSGKCASLSGIVANNTVTTYHCVDYSICRSLELDDSCRRLEGDREIRGCCCDNVNYCNVNDTSISIPTPSPNVEFPITCWSGLSVNGNDLVNPRWTVCNGDCASVTINTTISNVTHTATLYTCDPTSVCGALRVRNRCHDIEPGVQTCCCDTNECINPKKGKNPGRPLECYVGVQSTYANVNAGATVYCPGKCASLSSTIQGQNVTTYHCVDSKLCRSLELDDSCTTLYGDREVTGCCCDNKSFCNINGTQIVAPTPGPLHEYPITCWNGLTVNGYYYTEPSWQVCHGDCMSITMNTTIGSTNHTATIFGCDPTSVCTQLKMQNSCQNLEPGLAGCCCNTDQCIDPRKSRTPGNPLQCYVGVRSTYNNINAGASVYCHGKCASLSTTLQGQNVTTYHCVDSSVCRSLELDDQCTTLTGDREITGCCCDNKNFCTVKDPSITVPTPGPLREFPITCWSGLNVNGNWISGAKWQVCNGDCMSITINTSIANVNHTASIYGCDPTSVCTQLKMQNSCQNIEPGVGGCCCNTDQCIDPRKGKSPANPLLCYVGVRSTYNNINAGASVYCHGKCASLASTVQGQNITTYHCVDTSVCRSLELDDACTTLTGDREITGCCCDNTNFCNVNDSSIIPPTVSPVHEYPITCWSGLNVNGNWLTAAKWQVCHGDCMSVTINTSIANVNHTGTIYGCDPTSVCTQLNVQNNCTQLEPGVGGCCCNTDQCIDPWKGKTPATPLLCYVGMKSTYNNLNAGASIQCAGKCSSLSSQVGGYNVTTFHCVDSGVCRSLELDDACTTITGDRDVTGCCCDNTNFCNVALSGATGITIPPVTVSNETTIACYSGIWLNGAAITKSGYTACSGQCASVSINTTIGATKHVATIYTCDPSSVCDQLKLNNACADVEPGVNGCCCKGDACIDPLKGKLPGKKLNCYVGVYAGYNNYSVGADVPCYGGQCASLQTTYNGSMVKAYACVQPDTCSALRINNACQKVSTDRDITACCCDTSDHCNVGSESMIVQPPPNTNWTGTPIACYSGLVIDGVAQGNPTWTGCQGQCAAVQLNTTISQTAHSATLYTCDPSVVCTSLKLNNACGNLDTVPGLTGCCCSSDACLGPDSIYPKNNVPGTNAAASNMSVLTVLLTAVYMMLLRQ